MKIWACLLINILTLCSLDPKLANPLIINIASAKIKIQIRQRNFPFNPEKIYNEPNPKCSIF
jgi:hypothetical protein